MVIEGIFSTRQILIGGAQFYSDESRRVRNYGSGSFDWGCDGSGAAQLALALLLFIFPRGIKIGENSRVGGFSPVCSVCRFLFTPTPFIERR